MFCLVGVVGVVSETYDASVYIVINQGLDVSDVEVSFQKGEGRLLGIVTYAVIMRNEYGRTGLWDAWFPLFAK